MGIHAAQRRLDRTGGPRWRQPHDDRARPGRHIHPQADCSSNAASRTLYWSDREGMRVMRCDLDGSNVETLVQTGQGDEDRRDQTRMVRRDHRRLRTAGTSTGRRRAASDAGLGTDPPCRDRSSCRRDPAASAATSRCCSTGCPSRSTSSSTPRPALLYWTDRGDPPRGNTVNRAPTGRDQRAPAAARDPADPPRWKASASRSTGAANRMFVTDFGGSVATADLDGSNRRPILGVQGNLTGIAYAELSSNGGPR